VPSRSIEVERKNSRPASPRRQGRGKMAQVLQLGAAVFAVVLAINAIVGGDGLIAVLQARHETAALRQKLEQDKAENDRLEQQIQRLKYDPAAIEEVARREFGLIRRGEKVFIIQDLSSPAQP
jgi:cell division protein FtsB